MKDDAKKYWPIKFDALRPPTSLSTPISVIAIAIFITCLAIALLALGWLFADLVSGDQKRGSEAAKTALPILAGAIGLPLIIWRLLILDRQTRISEEKTQIDRETHYTSIFSRSIDQLGQTREIKSLQFIDGKSESISKTAPNIEVRLGGIHSLARLADESLRDRSKIENTLLSYVRENSWSDRSGTTITSPERSRKSWWSWYYSYSTGDRTTESEAEFKQWQKERAAQSNEQISWGLGLSETRVDVNEAIDAIANLKNDPPRGSSRFYECLFVGVKLGSSILSSSTFERCTFVRCSFIPSTTINVSHSQIIECKVVELTNATIRFTQCKIDRLTISKATDPILKLFSCETSELSISGISGGTVDISHSGISNSRISGKNEIIIEMEYTAFAGGSISNFKASPLSNFRNCVLVKTALQGVRPK